MLNKKKSKVSFDFGFFLLCPIFDRFFVFFPQNSRRHFLKLLSSVVLYMCSPSAHSYEGVRMFLP